MGLRNTVEEFNTLQSIFPFPYIEASEDMMITKFNPAAAAAFGISAERAVGKNVTILMPKYVNKVNGKKVPRTSHDRYDMKASNHWYIFKILMINHRIVANYVSKIRSVGKANIVSPIVDNKTSHLAYRVNMSDSRSIEGETFPMELEVKMQFSNEGKIKFQVFLLCI